MAGIMTGYGMHVNALTLEDVATHGIDLTGRDLERCVAVHGEDLARSLFAVIELNERIPDPLVWYDQKFCEDTGLPTPSFSWADNLAMVLVRMFPHLYKDFTHEEDPRGLLEGKKVAGTQLRQHSE